jgi:non-ribosomal peptide synthetase component F
LSSPVAHEPFHLSKDLIAGLTALSNSQGGTIFMALLAGFTATLSARTGCGDICVGTTMANRAEEWREGIVGPVENTTIIRTQIHPAVPFNEILRRVRHSVLEAHTGQDLPFETLVVRLAEEGQLDLGSLGQVFFIFQNAIRRSLALSGIAVQRFGSVHAQAKPVLPIDGTCLAVTVEETPAGISGTCSYKTDAFSAKTVKSWIADYKMTLARAVADPDKPIGHLTASSRKQRATIATQQQA